MGFAAGGALVVLSGVAGGLAVGATESIAFFGKLTALQVLAVGALSMNAMAMLAPAIWGIEMEVLDLRQA